jgi:hypothetical protein
LGWACGGGSERRAGLPEVKLLEEVENHAKYEALPIIIDAINRVEVRASSSTGGVARESERRSCSGHVVEIAGKF